MAGTLTVPAARVERFSPGTGGSRPAAARRTPAGDRLFRDALAPRPAEPYPRTLARAWQVLTGPAGASFLRLFGAVHDAPALAPWPDFRRMATTDWLGVLEAGLRPRYADQAPALATAVLAVVRGLLLDRDATADTVRVDGAFAAFVALLDQPGRPPTNEYGGGPAG